MENRILSIQSHVVSGYVGNKAAVFPLQVLGYDVDIVNTVQLSNHTGYANGFKGKKFTGEDVAELFAGMEENSLLSQATHLIQGYCPSPSQLEHIRKMVISMKEKNADFTYVCDPVMGDNGRLYVSNEMVEKYREEAMAIADFITPNQFEAELLTGTEIKTVADAIRACEMLHAKGITVVVITSLFFDDNEITLVASKKAKGAAEAEERFKITVPKLPQYFTGTGDLVTALLVGRYIQTGRLSIACESALASMQGVLRRTAAYQKEHIRKGGDASHFRFKELRLIQSRDEIESPSTPVQAMPL